MASFKIQANDPLPFWVILQANKAVLPLANFALQLLHLVVNQAGLERWFSDFSNKKNKKRNRLGLKKMGQQAKICRFVRSYLMRLNNDRLPVSSATNRRPRVLWKSEAAARIMQILGWRHCSPFRGTLMRF
jgi:hypothetical protein